MAQVTFQKKAPLDDLEYNLETFADGSLLFAGSKLPDVNCPQFSANLCKVNNQGDVLWNIYSCSPILTNFRQINDVLVASNQDVWATSYTRDLNFAHKIHLNRFDKDGNLLWQRLVSDNYDNWGGYIWPHLTSDSENNVWGTTSRNFISFGDDSISTFPLIKTEPITNNIWKKEISIQHEQNIKFESYGIYSASPDDVIIYGNIIKNNNLYRGAFIISLNHLGQVNWSKIYENLFIDQIRSNFSNGDLLLSGNYKKDFALGRLTKAGEFSWLKKRKSNKDYMTVQPFLSFDHQNIWLSVINSYNDIEADTASIYKLDTLGNVLWGKGYWNCKYVAGVSGTPTLDNGFAFLWAHPSELVLTKVDTDGNLNTGCKIHEKGGFEWDNIDLVSIPLAVTIYDVALPPDESITWETTTLNTEDFCPEELASTDFITEDSICIGSPLYLVADPLSQADIYVWSGNAGTFNQGMGAIDTVIFNQNGLQKVQLIGKYGFCADTVTQTIQVIGKSFERQLQDTLLCDATEYYVNVEASTASAYQWNDGNQSPIRDLEVNGLYVVTITEGICEHQDSFQLTFFKTPENLMVSDTIVCENTTFSPDLDFTQNVNLLWNGQTSIPPFNLGNVEGFQTLEVQFDNGCFAKDSILVKILQCGDQSKVYIPNAISSQPNSVNRIFEIFAPNAIPIESAIYDRWGELIYSTPNGVWPRWEGTFKQKKAPEGVYVFICELQFLDGSEKVFETNLTVMP
jgi:hypothetical protein